MAILGIKIDKYFFIKAFLLCAFFVFTYFRVLKENELGDFHVFWNAGKTLLEGGDIYYIHPEWRAFIYPPFAAAFFIPLSILPFKVACFLFFQINLICFLVSAGLVKKILALFNSDKEVLKYTYWLSLALIFKISWNNLMMVQVNQIVYLFIFYGIYYFLKNKENYSIAFFCVAISLKVFPILFAFWVVIRGSKTAVLKFMMGAAVCIILPLFFSGITNGVNQLDFFYKGFVLNNAKNEGIGFGYASQSLPSLINRTFQPSTLTTEPSYMIFDFGEVNTKRTIASVQLFLFISMCLLFIYLKIKKIRILPIEPAITILVIHLISTCTWKAHLVGLVLVFALIANDILLRIKDKGIGFFSKFYIGYIIAFSLLGQMFIGKKWQMLFNAYGDYTFLMIFSLIFIVYILKKELRNS